ncbi:MAG TPA: AAA family ATPase [Patescibacteria group bacterium]|nr:AAA family ATPase [Patescibacteria group bacterium]
MAGKLAAGRPDPADATRGALTLGSVTVRLAVPGLVVLIGAAGSGKSTLVARLFSATDILSSDALRAAISGDAADQRATRPAFAILHGETRRRLAQGRLVIVDATSTELSARRSLLRIARAAGVPATAIVIAASPADVHVRNARRAGRVVPVEVVDRHLAGLARLGATPGDIAGSLRAEGFAAAHVLASDEEIDATRVVLSADQPSRTRPNARARSSTQTPFRR